MKKTIGVLLAEVNGEISNRPFKKLFTYDNTDLDGQSKVINAWDTLCFGGNNMVINYTPVVKFYDSAGVEISVSSSSYDLDKDNGTIMMHSATLDVARIEILTNVYPLANETVLERAWNQSVEDINVELYNDRLIEIQKPSYATSDEVTEINKELEPYNSIAKYFRFLQKKDDTHSFVFKDRGQFINIQPNKVDIEDTYPDYDISDGYPYGIVPDDISCDIYLKYPYYIQGSVILPGITLSSWVTDVDTEFNVDDRSVKILRKLIIYEIYLERYYYYLNLSGSGDAYQKRLGYQQQLMSISTEVFREGLKKHPPKMMSAESGRHHREVKTYDTPFSI